MSFHGVLDEVTHEWLEFFDKEKQNPENLRRIFWRLAPSFLPEGVDPNDTRVQAALEQIGKANDK